MSLPEVLLWRELKIRALGVKFRRQHPFGPFILDFYSAERRLAIEVDGWSHNMGALGRDERRDAYLRREGVRTLRLPAELVLKDMDSAVDAIQAELKR
jgi:very-short-patch-repair endonuclease